MHFYQSTRKRETESGTLVFAIQATIDLNKGLENSLKVVLANSDTSVRYVKSGRAILQAPPSDRYAAARGRKLNGV